MGAPIVGTSDIARHFLRHAGCGLLSFVPATWIRSASCLRRGWIHSGLRMAAGRPLEETDRLLNQVERIIRPTPEVESNSSRTGPELGIFPVTEPKPGH